MSKWHNTTKCSWNSCLVLLMVWMNEWICCCSSKYFHGQLGKKVDRLMFHCFDSGKTSDIKTRATSNMQTAWSTVADCLMFSRNPCYTFTLKGGRRRGERLGFGPQDFYFLTVKFLWGYWTALGCTHFSQTSSCHYKLTKLTTQLLHLNELIQTFDSWCSVSVQNSE